MADSTNAAPLEADLDYLSRMVTGLIDAAVVVDTNLRPMVWNEAYVRSTGLRPRVFLRKLKEEQAKCHDLLRLEVCQTNCLGRRCMESNRPVRIDEIKGGGPDEESEDRTFIVSAIPIRLSGTDGAILEIYRDVTAEARIQDRYKILLDRERRRAEILEELVKERTADLENSLEELRRTRAHLIQSEKLSSLGQLIAGIAHEINNPINFIYGNTDFLQSYVASFKQLISAYAEADLSEEHLKRIESVREDIDYAYLVEDVEKLLRAIRSGAERAAAIIRDLRAFIHGRPDQRAPVDILKCIRQTLNLLTHETKGRVDIVMEEGPEVPTVWGNEGELNQVFMNLLANAAQAIDGEGTITISFEPVGEMVQIAVTDTGSGITDADLLKVFDPFFTTKPVGKGTGLGLSISYSIVDSHGGKIWVDSRPGEGSTFFVTLPTGEPPSTEGEAK